MAQMRFKTRTPTEVRKTLTRVVNMVANGQIETKTANSIIYACNVLLSSIRTDDLEKRTDELERLVNELTK